MADTFYAKQNDAGIVVTGTITDADGAAVTLAGATALTFQARPPNESTPVISGTAVADPDQTANRGKWTYTLTGADLANSPGPYRVTLQVAWGAHIETFPSHGYNTLEIEEEVA